MDDHTREILATLIDILLQSDTEEDANHSHSMFDEVDTRALERLKERLYEDTHNV